MGEEEEELEMARLEFVKSKKLTRGVGCAAGKSFLCQSLGDHPATVPVTFCDQLKREANSTSLMPGSVSHLVQ